MSLFFKRRVIQSALIVFFIFLAIATAKSIACTRVLMVDKHQSVMAGRNMDWMEDMKTNLWVFPRGLTRDGHSGDKNSLQWTAKYGSVVATAYDLTAADGMNEKGLSTHVLWLKETDYGKRDESVPGMSVIIWSQFILDNFASVDEAVRFTQNTAFQLIPFYHAPTKKWVKIHLALDDASGDSAVIEYIDGHPHIYHDPAYKVLTNSPTLDKQVENAKQYQGLGGDKALPGSTDSEDRFVRASYYLLKMPPADSTRDEYVKLTSILNNAAEPELHADANHPNYGPTIWQTIADLSQGIYYFKSSTSFNTIWARLDAFNLAAGAPVMKLDLVNYPDRAGDVSKDFRPATQF